LQQYNYSILDLELRAVSYNSRQSVLQLNPSTTTTFQTVSYNSRNRAGTHTVGNGSPLVAALVVGHGNRGGSTSPSGVTAILRQRTPHGSEGGPPSNDVRLGGGECGADPALGGCAYIYIQTLCITRTSQPITDRAKGRARPIPARVPHVDPALPGTCRVLIEPTWPGLS
jgi:hypothetical protein